MALEDRINYIIERNQSCFAFSDIRDLEWPGSPLHTITYRSIGVGRNALSSAIYMIDCRIEEADLVECLTSPSQYIREYRKYYESGRSD
jgi:hypothetical protein